MSSVSEVFMFGFEENVIGRERLEFFKKIKAKNFILFRRNLENVQENIDILKNEFEDPLIAIDCEGGNVRRLKETEEFMFSNMNIGSSFDPTYAERVYFRCGKLLSSLGINLNLAPVVDLYALEGNVIGIRSFGSNEEYVSEFAKNAIIGLHKANVFSTVKHFVGYGAVKVDPHTNVPTFTLDVVELERALIPFKKVSNLTDFVMTGHIVVPFIDDLPITFSKNGLNMLRDFFKGPVITDDLEMGGAQVFPIHEIPLRALEAGNDMLAVCSNFEIQKEMVHSVEHSHLDLDTHIARIKSLKFPETSQIEVRDEYYVTLYKDDQFIPQKHFKFFKYAYFSEVKVEEGVQSFGDFSIDPTEEEINRITSTLTPNDVVVIAVYNAFRHIAQKELVQKVKNIASKVCVIITGDPLDRHIFDFADCVILTYSPLSRIIEYSLDVIKGIAYAKGRLPV